jgi:hypothetical protein
VKIGELSLKRGGASLCARQDPSSVPIRIAAQRTRCLIGAAPLAALEADRPHRESGEPVTASPETVCSRTVTWSEGVLLAWRPMGRQ